MSKLAILGGEPTITPTGGSTVDPWAYTDVTDAFVRYTGAKYALHVSSGTAALISGLIAADVGPGDEVLTVSHTWIASVAAILHCNAIPIFVDVDPDTFCMDVSKIEEKITPRTKAILPVDFYGHPAQIPEIMQIAERHDLTVIEDACQAGGADINGRKLGSIAHITAFSFSGKPLSGVGGGVLTTSDERLYQKAMLAGQHPSFLAAHIQDEDLRRYIDFGGRGENFRPLTNPLNDLYHADLRIDHRIRNCEFLTEKLADVEAVKTPYVRSGYKHVYHYYTCLTDFEKLGLSRDRFLDALRMEGVPTIAYICHANRYFSPGGESITAGPIHLRTIFQELDYYGKGCPFKCPFGVEPKYEKGSLPVTERLAWQEWSLLQPTLSAPNGLREMQLIVDAVNKVLDDADELAEADDTQLVARYR